MDTLFSDKFLVAIDNHAMIGMTNAQKEMLIFSSWVENQTVCTIQDVGVSGNELSIVTELEHPLRMANDLQLSFNAWIVRESLR